jgi:hypothetical protein
MTLERTGVSPTAIPVPPASPAAIDLFACIGRFEFALKESGFVAGAEGGNAGPDWGRFQALAGDRGAFDKLRSLEAARLLFDEPPSKQIRQGDSSTWSPPLTVENMHDLGLAIRQVRNNLFHGGKAGANPRDDDLCHAATAALLFLIEVDGGVRSAFLGEY